MVIGYIQEPSFDHLKLLLTFSSFCTEKFKIGCQLVDYDLKSVSESKYLFNKCCLTIYVIIIVT
jgi:hypothetical protein